jgi:LacI family transcriptional regulator
MPPMNLKALAAHLGLSQGTVSRALNGYPSISQETRERVSEAAIRFGYRPNQSARALATGRADAIGIVFAADENPLLDPHFLEFLAGAAEAGAARDLSINLAATSPQEELARYERLARTRQVDGFLVNAPLVEDPRIEALQRIGAPFIVHARTQANSPYAWLDIDNHGAFERATRLLLDFDHRRIALLNGHLRYSYATHRLAGYSTALEEAGLPLDPDLIVSGPMTEEVGFRETRRMLALGERPTAILCGSMLVALGVLRALRDSGLDVPGDCSVIAHDDVFPFITPESLRPTLTTTRSPIRIHGRRIVAMLTALIEGAPPESQQELLPMELVMRDSVARAPKRA